MTKTTLILTLALIIFGSANLQAGHKGFVISSDNGDSLLKISGRIQARYTFESVDGINKGADDKSTFNIPRARLKLSGHLFEKKVSYYFQTDFGNGKAILKDFFTDYVVDKKWLRIRIGQWKRPFSRQQLTSSGKQEMVDRAITDKAFLNGRDMGLEINNHYIESPEFEYALGVFNGHGISTGNFEDGQFPSRFNPTLVARLGYNYGGIKGYSEADFEGGGLRFAIGGSALINLDIDEDDTDDQGLMGEVDFMVKLHGLTAAGEFFYSKGEGESTLDGKLVGKQWGFRAQLGYLILGKYQPVARYAMVKNNDTKSTESEIATGFSIYPHKHNFKWQSDVAIKSRKSDGTDATTEYLIRSQIQVAF
jgi:hypothetical protein